MEKTESDGMPKKTCKPHKRRKPPSSDDETASGVSGKRSSFKGKF